MIILTQLNQVMYRQLVCAAFISCVHRLRGAQYIRDFLLGFVSIFAQITHDLYILDATPPLIGFLAPYYNQFFT